MNLILGIVIFVFVYWLLGPGISGFKRTESECGGQCIRGAHNVPMDAYGCCGCLAGSLQNSPDGTDDKDDPSFRKCMCKFGYGDFCYRGSTNTLLPGY